jgi:hypothetical protein
MFQKTAIAMEKKLFVKALALALGLSLGAGAALGDSGAPARGPLVGLAKSKGAFTVGGARNGEVSTPVRAGEIIESGGRPVSAQTPRGHSLLIGRNSAISFESAETIRLHRGNVAVSFGPDRFPLRVLFEDLAFAPASSGQSGQSGQPMLLLDAPSAQQVAAGASALVFSVEIAGGVHPERLASLGDGDNMTFHRGGSQGWTAYAESSVSSTPKVLLLQNVSNGAPEADMAAADSAGADAGVETADAAASSESGEMTSDDEASLLQYDELPRHKVAYTIAGSSTDLSVGSLEAITTGGNDDVVAIAGEAPLITQVRWDSSISQLVGERQVGTKRDLVVIDADRAGSTNEEIRLLTDTPEVDEYQPVWGDGKYYYVSDRDGGSAIYSMDHNGEPETVERLTEPALKAQNPDQRVRSGVPGDSTDLVFDGEDPASGRRAIYILPLAGGVGDPSILISNSEADLTSPRWSPDGDQVAYIVDPGNGTKNIQIYDVDEDEVVVAALLPNTTDIGTSALDFTWSPSGERFAATYSSTPGGPNDTLAVLNKNGEVVRFLSSSTEESVPGFWYLNPDWRGGFIPIIAWWQTPAFVGGAAAAGGAAVVGGGVVVVADDDDNNDGDDTTPPPPPFSPIAPPDDDHTPPDEENPDEENPVR